MKLILFILALFFSIKLIAQRSESGAWLSVQLPLQFSDEWQMHNDAGYRTLGNNIASSQYLFRPGIRYSINKHWSTAGGVAFFRTRTSLEKKNCEFQKEFRFWQEAVYKRDIIKDLQWQSRVRIEQRSFSATFSKASFHAFRYRIRTQLQKKISNKWALLIADEYMRQHTFNKWSFDQNRLMANAVYFFDKNTQLQMGYMWILRPYHLSQNILTISFQKTISLHGK